MRFIAIATISCIIAFTSAHVYAESEKKSVQIETPYAFATAEQQKAGAAFMTITLTEADTLLSASTDIAETVEIHDMSMEDGMMKMRKLDNLQIEDSVILNPTSKHIMLIGLKEPLNKDGSFPLTLTFEKAGEHTVDVSVVAPGKKPEGKHDHYGHDHNHHGHDH